MPANGFGKLDTDKEAANGDPCGDSGSTTRGTEHPTGQAPTGPQTTMLHGEWFHVRRSPLGRSQNLGSREKLPSHPLCGAIAPTQSPPALPKRSLQAIGIALPPTASP